MESNKIAGTTVVAAIVPGTTADIYPTHLAEYGKGGWRSVSNFAALSSITAGRIENGMVAYVLDQNKPYIYLNGWEELELGTKIQGVFQFKGIAENISIDNSMITLGKVYTRTEKDQDEYIYTSLTCERTAMDLLGDVYYSWEDSNQKIEFWTSTPELTDNTTLYKIDDATVYSVIDNNGVVYYLAHNYPSPIADDEGKHYIFYSLDASPSAENPYANSIYIICNSLISDIADGSVLLVYSPASYEALDLTVTFHTYTTHKFTLLDPLVSLYVDEAGTPLSDTNRVIEIITAAPDNSGHVYQIGENEYASNGQIWVKLGTPVEDWIIL